MNEKLLTRYLKVKALAEGGEGGERASAQKILRSFEQKHPGISAAAAAHEKAQNGASLRPPPWRTGSRPGSGNWEQIFRYAAGFYETVKDVVEDVSDAHYGRTLAQAEVRFSGNTRDSHIFVRLKIHFDAVVEARDLNAIQKEAFRQAVHDMLEEYLDSILAEGE
jgi:hypothetical protein